MDRLSDQRILFPWNTNQQLPVPRGTGLGQQLDPGPGTSGLSRLGLGGEGLSRLAQVLEITLDIL